mmetsp:Transcript_38676/g.94944  ORF Transcript_38676/g.94944 Transcript_38676/m.94944 type:complete len:384 (-) Transcript_38676:91-1242(-)
MGFDLLRKLTRLRSQSFGIGCFGCSRGPHDRRHVDVGQQRQVDSSSECCLSAMRFTVGECLGQGTFGAVWRAVDDTGREVAVKRVPKFTNQSGREMLLAFTARRCAQCVRLLDYFLTRGPASILIQNFVFEFIRTPLSALIRRHRRESSALSVSLVWDITRDVTKALAFLHSSNVVHRDVKPANILVCEAGPVAAKLCDFGAGKVMTDQTGPAELNSVYIVTRLYRAPEVLLGAVSYGCAVDVWSLACVIGEMLLLWPLICGEHPQGSGDPGAAEPYQLLAILDILGAPSKEEVVALEAVGAHIPQEVLSGVEGIQPFHLCSALIPFLQSGQEALPVVLSQCFRWNPAQRLSSNQILHTLPVVSPAKNREDQGLPLPKFPKLS